MASTVMRLKGLADIGVGVILALKPEIIYESNATKALGRLTGFGLSSAKTAPGFNHAIACMVVAVGVGSVVASFQGRAARFPIVIMNATWGLLAGLTCVFTPHLATATMVMTALNTGVYTVVMGILGMREGSKSAGKSGSGLSGKKD
ncbi:hypothetical protein DFP72DRAFT_1172188 [Ephemerocybe angulata]|uniref:Uncharacterized protein n=1 Tax=Ephemerocybe angulata TaxID=980116 RepID=A0A8H6HSB1_9AGAR|nr:hypothetical protein DFP72DRAFT_1172188 [Tulosesus angulatus]